MGVKWTSEQRQVIDLDGCNILVSAAAGSGKTAVLVERIIQKLIRDENPVSVDELLIVTFTEAAAAEMKDRIRGAIEKKLEEYPENEHLRQQATLIHNAQITTIHSFCLSVIREHFHKIDLDPGFRIGEDGELKLLRHEP
jgi:ATP-dependent helicase/nuclease subunit A